MRFSNFHRFIGIDWSGAKDPRRGLRVAQCFRGHVVPEIILNQSSRNWRRKEILDWLIQLNKGGEKVLAGFDFAFAYPYCDAEAYFPKHNQTLKDAASLWKLVDHICRDARDFYGGPFYLTQDAHFSDYLLYQKYTGGKWKEYPNRMRITDNHCAEKAGNPSSVFKCVGPESVGIGSVAGMRLLHDVNSNLTKEFLIWPFQRRSNERSVIVEIFPRFFYILAGANPRKWQNRENVNNALKWFGSEALPLDMALATEDQVDAIISAAALRHLAGKPDSWQPAGLTDCARSYEGWIFGVV